MKYLKILVIAACAALGAMIGGAGSSQATPMSGLLLGAPAVQALETLDAKASPVEKAYWRRHYWRRHYWRRHYWHRRYYHPYWHRRYYHRRYYRYW